jgi:hypothetical protein
MAKPCTNQNCCTVDCNAISGLLSASYTNELLLNKNTLLSNVTSTIIQELYTTVYQLPTSLVRLASDVWSHVKHEPKKPTWNIQTTLVMGFLQAFRDQSLANSLEFWRLMLIAPTFLRPIRSKTEPEYILVKKRNLCGILKTLDAAEKGSKLDAEWMSALSTWEKIYGGPSPLGQQKNAPLMLEAPPSCEKIVFYLHGGAYCAMSAQTHRTLTYKISKSTKRRVLGKCYYRYLYMVF